VVAYCLGITNLDPIFHKNVQSQESYSYLCYYPVIIANIMKAKIHFLAALAVLSLASCQHAPKFTYSISWENKNERHEHFTDMGNYVLMNDAVDFKDFDLFNERIAASDVFKPSCTSTAKRNKKGEVIIGRNMDIDISQTPAIITPVTGGKYETIAFTYQGPTKDYNYFDMSLLDKDNVYLGSAAFRASDAMNEKGLYAEVNMREMDDGRDFYCHGTNPGKKRVSLMSATTLIALNCATVKEALAYIADSYDWYTPGFILSEEYCVWTLSILIGDATGEYGIIEFGCDSFRYIPYANGQANYYIHPDYAEYAVEGTGYGRLSAALKGLPDCETELDMMKNMEACFWAKEIRDPGCMGYSDFLGNINDRRAYSEAEMKAGFIKWMEPFQTAANEYYNGNEQPLRDAGDVWTSSFNFGVNCAQKHLLLRFWERDDLIFECWWK
jgi:Penicillin V acylase and related amidases